MNVGQERNDETVAIANPGTSQDETVANPGTGQDETVANPATGQDETVANPAATGQVNCRLRSAGSAQLTYQRAVTMKP